MCAFGYIWTYLKHLDVQEHLFGYVLIYVRNNWMHFNMIESILKYVWICLDIFDIIGHMWSIVGYLWMDVN